MLMPCPECKHSLSDTADDCPKCGYKLTEEARIAFRTKTAELERRGRIVLGWVAVVLLVLGVALSIPGFYSTKAPYRTADDAERLKILSYAVDGQRLTDTEKDLLKRGWSGGEPLPSNPGPVLTCASVVFGLPALGIFIYLMLSNPGSQGSSEPPQDTGWRANKPSQDSATAANDTIPMTPLRLLASFLATALLFMWGIAGMLFIEDKLGAWLFSGATALMLPTAFLIYAALKEGTIS